VKLNLLALGVLLSGGIPGAARAQVLEARIGRFYDSPGWTAYRAGFTRPLGGVVAVQIHGDYLQRVAGVGRFAGVGTDVTAFRTGGQGPYLVAGVSGGLGSDSTSSFSTLWGSWSAGAGYDVFPMSFLSVGVEGRWRELTVAGRSGFELAAGVGIHIGRGSSLPDRRPPPVSSEDPVLIPAGGPASESGSPGFAQGRPTTLADSIVATATNAMGRPYEFGGTGKDGEGFDCSGLIQYAYRKHGIELPRRSVDQAREGRKIDRSPQTLAPADVLTFSNHGGQVTHVGLYIGSGRFIHSATRGVQISTLRPDDPYGRWWYKRWVGVRRIVK
jgi:cell wall-associated NlpC family hydrolase